MAEIETLLPAADPNKMRCALVLFTRDLRVHDHPALAAAVRDADTVVPAFIFDDELLGGPHSSPNRVAFLLDSLADLDAALRQRGGHLVWRRGRFIEEAARLAQEHQADAIYYSSDVSAYARRRHIQLQELGGSLKLRARPFPGVSVCMPGDVLPTGGDHFRVFTPYFNRWWNAPIRAEAATPSRIQLASNTPAKPLPGLASLASGVPSPQRMAGGESLARSLFERWVKEHLEEYEKIHDDLAADTTSRLSPYLHFGNLSAAEIVRRLRPNPAAEPFLRQLCWRDFHHQVTAAFPRIIGADYRPRGDQWDRDRSKFEAWKEGRTGYPIVDAGMRQLAAEGWMHNRARMITASFLVKDLYLDWRWGARHFMDLLVDGDTANNYGNWQWIAGTGNDTRPNRVFSPARQALRFDPQGDYVRRWVPELAAIPGSAIHDGQPSEPNLFQSSSYPPPIVDHARATARFLAARKAP